MKCFGLPRLSEKILTSMKKKYLTELEFQHRRGRGEFSVRKQIIDLTKH